MTGPISKHERRYANCICCGKRVRVKDVGLFAEHTVRRYNRSQRSKLRRCPNSGHTPL